VIQHRKNAEIVVFFDFAARRAGAASFPRPVAHRAGAARYRERTSAMNRGMNPGRCYERTNPHRGGIADEGNSPRQPARRTRSTVRPGRSTDEREDRTLGRGYRTLKRDRSKGGRDCNAPRRDHSTREPADHTLCRDTNTTRRDHSSLEREDSTLVREEITVERDRGTSCRREINRERADSAFVRVVDTGEREDNTSGREDSTSLHEHGTRENGAISTARLRRNRTRTPILLTEGNEGNEGRENGPTLCSLRCLRFKFRRLNWSPDRRQHVVAKHPRPIASTDCR
jgi:hypothetical protein